MKPMLAPSWPGAIRFLAEWLPADRTLHFVFGAPCCREAVAHGSGLDVLPQSCQFRCDDRRAGFDVGERLQPGPHPDRHGAGIVLDGEH